MSEWPSPVLGLPQDRCVSGLEPYLSLYNFNVPAVLPVRKCICLTDLEQTAVASLVLAEMQQ